MGLRSHANSTHLHPRPALHMALSEGLAPGQGPPAPEKSPGQVAVTLPIRQRQAAGEQAARKSKRRGTGTRGTLTSVYLHLLAALTSTLPMWFHVAASVARGQPHRAGRGHQGGPPRGVYPGSGQPSPFLEGSRGQMSTEAWPLGCALPLQGVPRIRKDSQGSLPHTHYGRRLELGP